MKSYRRLMRVVTLLVLGAFASIAGLAVASAPPAAMIKALTNGNVYISPAELKNGDAKPGDQQRLEDQARSAASQGVPEKFAILNKSPGTAPAAAHTLRQILNFSGVFILISKQHGIGISSDTMSTSDDTKIAQQVARLCFTQGYGDCALAAGKLAVTQVKNDNAANNRAGVIFFIVVLVVIAGIIALVIWGVLRSRRRVQARLKELRTAANNTLSMADDAVNQIEASQNGQKMATGPQHDYDAALALRQQAQTELEKGGSPDVLSQANQDAAQALLGLQGVMRTLKISSPLANPLDAPSRRCFYCGRQDRPPYTKEEIKDDKGNTMQVDVCSVCEAQLQKGRKPEIATVNYQGSQVPWWAVPGNPWYYGYGGPTWGYWLPFVIGMDMGNWFGGGWNYGPQGYTSGGDGGSGGGIDWGGVAGSISDAGGVEWGGGGGDSGGGDSGGGGGDWG